LRIGVTRTFPPPFYKFLLAAPPPPPTHTHTHTQQNMSEEIGSIET